MCLSHSLSEVQGSEKNLIAQLVSQLSLSEIMVQGRTSIGQKHVSQLSLSERSHLVLPQTETVLLFFFLLISTVAFKYLFCLNVVNLCQGSLALRLDKAPIKSLVSGLCVRRLRPAH